MEPRCTCVIWGAVAGTELIGQVHSSAAKSTHIFTQVEEQILVLTLVKVVVLIHLLYISKSEKVQALKCTTGYN